MALNHKALFTWLMVLTFFVLLVVRLDEKVTWNWFIIFIPMWLFDCVCLVFTIFYMITQCYNGPEWRNRVRASSLTMNRQVWSLFVVLLKLAFQVLLCLRLEYIQKMRLPIVLAPLWILLVGVIAEVMTSLVSIFNQ